MNRRSIRRCFGIALLAAGCAGAQTISGLIPVTPCRMIDTRKNTGQGYPPPYGTPAFAAGERRTFTVDGAIAASNPCAGVVPTGITALAVNLTAVAPTGAGDLREAPGNVVSPTPLTTSILNFSNVTIANATVVPVSTDEITLGMGAAGTGVLMDVYGYFQGPVLSSVTTDGITLSGNGTGASPLGIANGGVGPVQLSASGSGAGQVLTSNGSSVSWQNQSGLTSVTTDTTLTGNGTGGLPLGFALPASLSANTSSPLITANNAGGGLGLYGLSASGNGIYGVNQSSSTLSFVYGSGVWGDTANGVGVFGSSFSANGVVGIHHGYAFDPFQNAGVMGEADDTPGVVGVSNAQPGVVGESQNQAGVQGTGGTSGGNIGQAGVSGIGGSGNGSSHLSGPGVLGVGGSPLSGADGGVGVSGFGTANVGVTGYGGTDAGGFGANGVFGQGANGSGAGNLSGAGVFGAGGTGMSGASGGFGVYGATAATDPGISGVFGDNGLSGATQIASAGVTGMSAGGDGVFGATASGTHSGVAGVNTGGGIGVIGVSATNGLAVYASGGFGGTGAKYFIEPHPTDPTKEIRFVSLEGPESGTYFRGTGHIVNGLATIDVPESFRMVTAEKGLTVVATPVGEAATLFVVKRSLDSIVIQGSSDVEFDYMVNGVRKAFADHQPIVENKMFIPKTAKDPNFTLGLPQESVRRLKANGILNGDGSINAETANKYGWDKQAGWAREGIQK